MELLVSKKKKNKIIIIFCVSFAFLGLSVVFFLLFVFSHNKLILIKTPEILTAGNKSLTFLKINYDFNIRQKLFPYNKPLDIEIINGKNLVNVIKTKDGIYLKVKNMQGNVVYDIISEDEKIRSATSVVLDMSDSDNDGFPDIMELTNEPDISNFINWFVDIAESQFYKESYGWAEINKSCSGLVTFAYKEALKKHTNEWVRNYKFLIRKNIGDVEKFNYPEIPVLGDRIFRTKKPPFTKDDLSDDTYNITANVNTLMNFNLKFSGKDISMIKKGDVLFFLNENHPEYPYHSMIYCGDNKNIVYHTGHIDDKNNGEVRLIKIDLLSKHPDWKWHPKIDNPNFIGFFRWNIIN